MKLRRVVQYSRKYFNLAKEGYKRVWFRLHTTPDSSKWTNILLICGLLFSLPYSTGKVERFISSLKLTKTDRRTKLHFSTLNVAHDRSSTSESEPEEETLTLDDWDKWFDTEDSD